MTDEIAMYKREIERLREKLATCDAAYRELKAKYDKQISDEGWRQSADWANRSGGTL